MAFTAVAALVAGSEVTATLVLAAATEVGTAMTVIGAVTGNKELMKIGGVIGLVGGVGGLINGAISGAAAGAGASDAAMSEGAQVGAANAGTEATDLANVMGDGAAPTNGIISSAVEPVSAPAVTDLSAAPMQTPGAEIDQATQVAAPVDSPTSTPVDASTSTVQAPDVQAPQGPAGAQAPTTPYDINTDPNSMPSDLRMQTGTQTSPTAPQDSGSFFNSFSQWANKNKTLLGAGLQVAGGVFNGMNQRSMWDQKMALEQQRLGQTSYGSQVGTWAPTPQPGLIGSARG